MFNYRLWNRNSMLYQNKYICHRKQKYKAFTLAEVLITLVIIGVIAAITVPTIIQNTEKQEFVTALKKSNSVLKQAFISIARNSGYPLGDYEFYNDANFLDEFGNVVNVVKKCNTQAECFSTKLYGGNTEYKNLNNTPANTYNTWSDGKSLITADGMMYTFVKLSSASASIHGLNERDTNNTIGRIVVDVNGQRKPNKFGLDTFVFYVVNGRGIVPAGDYSTDTCVRTSHGSSCAAKVLREGKISY